MSKGKSRHKKIKNNNTAENTLIWDIMDDESSSLIPNTLYNILAYLLLDIQPAMNENARVSLQ